MEPLEQGSLNIKPAGVIVYIVHGWAGEILYVGLTNDLCRRMASHRTGSGWWDNAGRVTWELWPDRHTARGREADLIAEHRPPWNIHRNGDHQPRQHPRVAWERLGATMQEQRESAGHTRTMLANAAGVEPSVVRLVERGGGEACPADALAAIEEALHWHQGSARAVLEGGDPDRLTGAERAARLRRTAASFLEGRAL